MGNKDRAKHSSRKAAARTLKEKRLAKKAKRDDKTRTSNTSVDKAFDR